MTNTHVPTAQADTAMGRRRRWRAEHLRAGWPQVRIDVVEAEPGARGCRVRAVVDLGDLAPADVRVGLGPAEVAGTEPCAAHRDEERMWSSHAYDNGRVVFERVVAPGEDAAGEWVVCVHPAHELPGRPVVYRLRVEAPAAPDSAHA
jgi:hypothetical protein